MGLGKSFIENVGNTLSGGLTGLVTGGVQQLLNERAGNRQWKRQKEAMEIQQQNQKELNQFNQELQLDTWNKTNFEAQRKHIEDAGLSVGLMYGGSGAGGTTVGSYGGSAGMASPSQEQSANLGNTMAIGMQTQLLQAQKENIEADTRNKLAEAENKGADTSLKGSQKLNTEQDTLNKKAEELGQLTLNEINSLSKNDQVEYWKWLSNKALAESQKLSTETDILYNSKDALIRKNKAESIGSEINNELTKSKIGKTELETKAIANDIELKWKQLENENQKILQGWNQLNQNEKNIKINEAKNKIEQFKAEIQANYPHAMQVIGKTVDDGIKALYNITGTPELNQRKIK